MLKNIKFIITTLSILFLVVFSVFVFNQVMQVYLYTSQIDPDLGQAVLIALVALITFLAFTPVYLYFRMPSPLLPPNEGDDRTVYLQKLGNRLNRNKLIKAASIKIEPENEGQIYTSLKILDKEADKKIMDSAKAVFFTTAISQNGKLDALTVLLAQVRMVWKISHIYNQRPTFKDMLFLYGNVGASALLASELEDMDFSEQLEPVMGTFLQGNAVKSIPFVGTLSSVIMDSLLEGSINAFLTLRVGIVARKYCSTTSTFKPKKARREAFKEAPALLKTIVAQSSGEVVSTITKAAKRAGTDTIQSGVNAAERATARIKTTFSKFSGKQKDMSGQSDIEGEVI